jgi:cytochrome c
VNGPAFQAIAERYRSNRAFSVSSIYRKIIYGGTGNWGQTAMTPHPQIREEEAIQMCLWILSLGDPPKAVLRIPVFGDYALNPEKEGKPAERGAFVLQAKYLDRGSQGQPKLESHAILVLRPATLQAENCDTRSDGVGNYKPFGNDTTLLQELKHNAYFAFRQVDLAGVNSLILRLGYGDKTHPYAGGKLEIRAGTVHGALIGEAVFESKNGERMVFEDRKIELKHPFSAESPLQDLFFVFRNVQNQGQGVIAVDWVRFVYAAK